MGADALLAGKTIGSPRAALRQSLAMLLVAFLLFPASPAAGAWGAEVIHREQSLYQTILVVRRGDLLCLQFSTRQERRNQSCRDETDPNRLVFSYTRMMLAALLLNPAPERIFMAGLGGGSLVVALGQLLPEATIDVVEIDPAVVDVARRFFEFQPNSRTNVVVRDARVFAKRALREGASYDLILLDAYGGDYIPEHLMTVEFLEEIGGLLAPGGVVVANTFAHSQLYDHESVTYRQVFGPFYNLRRNESDNRIVLAMTEPLPPQELLTTNANRWRGAMRPLGVPVTTYPRDLTTRIDWDRDKRPLTDQYSPANLLRERPR